MSEERSCGTCEYIELRAYNDHCNTCGDYSNWIPIRRPEEHTSPIIDELLNTITPEQQAKVEADMIEELLREALRPDGKKPMICTKINQQ